VRRLSLTLLIATVLCGRAAAEPVLLRFASIAPEGTAWARELKAYARDVELLSHGELRIRWYLGGIAGDESVTPARIRKGQLDGEAAGVTCDRLAPSLKVLRIAGLLRRRDEAESVVARLVPTLEREFQHSGMTLLGMTWFGSDIIFSRVPVRSMADLRHLRFWIWNLDEVWVAELRGLGLKTVPLPVEEAGRAYDDGRVDGLLALPTAALAFQWSVRTRYFTNLPMASMAACIFVSNRAFDALPTESKSALVAAGGKLNFRFKDINAAQEDALLGGLFERQRTRAVAASPIFQAEFLDSARQAREAIPDGVVPRALIVTVQTWLSDYRAEHP
jgi:TRAP-type C4-dicarboxylate transport system substrate-binding protein